MATNWRKGEPKIWRWRIRGKSSDSKIVTLGKYDSEPEAKVDYDKLLAEGYYRNVKIEQIKHVPVPADPVAEP